jgi:HAMP domain-containing protein
VCAKRADMKAAQERRSAVERAAAERAVAAQAAGAKLGSDAPAAPLVVRASTPAREDLTPDPFRDICERQGMAARVFRPQTVPAFAATEIFNFLSKKYPEYQYKEATLNPTNPRDRAVDWEEDIVKAFRNRPDLTAVDGERTSALGRSVFLARPMRAAKACLECHSTPAAAPQDMIALYGPANGFGWKEDEVIAAQIVSVPVSVSVAMADRAFRQLVISLAAVAGLTLILLDLVLFLTVIRPVSRLAAMADEISTGHMDVPELEVTGSDEVSLLAASFNRMHRSLTTAMKLLDGGDDANG